MQRICLKPFPGENWNLSEMAYILHNIFSDSLLHIFILNAPLSAHYCLQNITSVARLRVPRVSPRRWHKSHGGGKAFHAGHNRQSHQLSGCPCVDVAGRGRSSSTRAPVSQWPTTTRWRQTNKRTDGQTDGHRHCVKPPPLSEGLILRF